MNFEFLENSGLIKPGPREVPYIFFKFGFYSSPHFSHDNDLLKRSGQMSFRMSHFLHTSDCFLF